jgi:integrase/recombinase XerD
MEITIKPILWTYRKIKETDNKCIAGEHEVRIRLTQDRDPKYISTGFSSSVENWNEDHGRPDWILRRA